MAIMGIICIILVGAFYGGIIAFLVVGFIRIRRGEL
jgi:hypothetical protein